MCFIENDIEENCYHSLQANFSLHNDNSTRLSSKFLIVHICEVFEIYILATRIDLLCERIPSNSLLPDFSASVIECARVK